MDDVSNSPADEVLYHYCGAGAFLSIIQNRTIWLSGISLANDTMEGRIVANTLMRLADASVDLTPDQRLEMRNAIEMVGKIFEGFAFCLSKASDSLSQWRGYAADGAGYSIGFSRKYLTRLAQTVSTQHGGPQLGDVSYKAEEHERLAWPVFEAISKLAKANELTNGFRFGGLLSSPLPPLEQIQRDKQYQEARLALLIEAANAIRSLQFLKQSGFSEEREVRLIAPLFSKHDGVEFRARGNDIVPYVPLELQQLEGFSPIKVVWIGPKNRTPDHLVDAALTRYGFPTIPVIRSDTTYR